MTSPQITYNPGILGDKELEHSFVVRQQSLELILESLRENAASPSGNRHLIMIGPRGIGKTMLVRRTAAAVRSTPEYSSKWYPLVFGEESYPVSTPGEFWLEALFHLADQTGEPRWEKTLDELRNEQDDARLRERALSQLLDFADHEGKRILLIVENLNTLIGQQMAADSAWDLRHTLLNEPQLMLLGTATNRFDEIEDIGHAWFEMFAVHQLLPLTSDECGDLWRSVTGSLLERSPLKAIQILTGGNPRLLKILASFAANHSFRQLMEQLVHLIDDHTEYFKGHLDSLASKERRVFVGLLERWDPIGAGELARHTRLNVNEVSALLGRLRERGAVEVSHQKGRRKLYQASERLYNIYYLMRRRGHPEGRVKAAVQFMVTFYEREELVMRLADLAREACELPEDIRKDHYCAYSEVLRKIPQIAPLVIECTQSEFFLSHDAKSAREAGISGLIEEAHSSYHGEKFTDAENLYRRALQLDENDVRAWSGLGTALFHDSKRLNESEQAFSRANALAPSGTVCHNLGSVYAIQKRWSEAEKAFGNAVKLDDKLAASWNSLGSIYISQERWEEADKALSNAVKLDPERTESWASLGYARFMLRDLVGAEQSFRISTQLAPRNGAFWNNLSVPLLQLGRVAESENALRKAVELAPENSDFWRSLGHLMLETGPPLEAEKVWDQALNLHGEELASCSVHLLELRLERGVEPGKILQEAREWIKRSKNSIKTLGVMAKFVARTRLIEGLPLAESWAQEAFSRAQDSDSSEALALVLAEMHKWGDAIQASKTMLDASDKDDSARKISTEFLIRAAAAGLGKEALEVLRGSAAAAALEPLAVGLEIYLGDVPVVAKEIFEIGNDVADRIRKYEAEAAKI